jgi:carboxypeptidase Taq
MSIAETYKQIVAWSKEVSMIGAVFEMLDWDLQVNLPKKGFARRSDQLGFMQGLRHRRLTDKEMVAKVYELADRMNELDADQQVNVREWKRTLDRATKAPVELVEEIARHNSLSQGVWIEARKESNFAKFAPYLSKCIDLQTQLVTAWGFANPYDGMLDASEPFATEASIAALLDDLKKRLVPFLHKILGAKRYDASAVVGRNFPVDKQREFGLAVIGKLGFDFDGGRQDVSAHPFCTGTKGDVRITSRFFADDPRPSLFGMIHEAGHAMYEQGLPDENLGTPLGESVSLGVHESQSRFWENIVGRSIPMWRYFYPQIKQAFPGALGDVALEMFHRCVNVVEPSLIRVEADEATYNLHIILRFEIERALVARKLAVADLPAAWNAKMKEYLNVDVPRDAEGVLQDVHWSLGSLGYFPTYTIGTLYGAQLWDTIRAEMPDVETRIARGEFAPLLAWLREKIHRHGKRYGGDELIERATGKKPTAAPFMNYLQEKFAPLYGL